jgi:hypothetical protein
MILACALALLLSNALQAFHIMLQIGAGTGLLFILRWFWWRINPLSEITAMVVSFLIAVYLQVIHPALGFAEISSHIKLLVGVCFTTIAWLLITLLTVPSDTATLRAFYRTVRPGGPGWRKVIEQARSDNDPIEEIGSRWDVPLGIVCMVFGCLAVYGALFATGYWIYGNYVPAAALTLLSVTAAVLLARSWKKLRTSS